MFDEFKSYLIDEKRREPMTAKFYVQDVTQLQQHFPDRDVYTLSTQDIQAYVDSISLKFKPRTILRKVSSIAVFYKWAVKIGRCTNSPICRVKADDSSVYSHCNLRMPSVASEERVCFSSAELEKMQLAIWSNNSFICLRDQAMYSLILFCGVRASELATMTISDVHDDGTLVIHRQKKACSVRKDITIDMGEVASTVVAYTRERLATDPSSDPQKTILFVNKYGDPISTRSIRRKLGAYAAKAGMRMTPSRALHSFALQSLQNGTSVEDLSRRLGHTNIATTRDYLHYIQPKTLAEPPPVLESVAV